ncbi:MAG TPA: hypothetical protein VEA15_02090 [Caulobacteraceae bacterium]|nr:hypothetical protein [Caulobacteraceae bacterium]
MADSIRSSFTPFTPTRPQASPDGARAAQRAFFNQALAQAQAPAAPTRAEIAAPARAVASPVATRAADASAPPERVMRPGSLLDIKI